MGRARIKHAIAATQLSKLVLRTNRQEKNITQADYHSDHQEEEQLLLHSRADRRMFGIWQ